MSTWLSDRRRSGSRHAQHRRRALKLVDPDLPMVGVRTMEQIVDLSIAADRFRTVLFASFGAVALLLAALGIMA